MISIVFGLDNGFVKHCAVAMASVICNSSEGINFFIIGDITSENKEKLDTLKDINTLSRNININHIKCDTELFDNLQLVPTITKATYYRLLVAEVVPKNIDKIIYLDCDLIVKGDVKELYDTDVENYYGAAVESYNAKNYAANLHMPPDAKYFNAGVILFNLKVIRSFDFLMECMKQYDNIKNIIQFADQDILNMVFYSHVKYLPVRWNFLSGYIKNEEPKSSISKNDIKIEKDNIKIIHYNGGKPWDKFNLHSLRQEYFIYAALTPWANELPSKFFRESKNLFYMLYRFLVYFFKHPLFFVRLKFWRKVFHCGFVNTIS